MSLKILHLCKKSPIPVLDGEGVAVMSLARAYKALGHSIDLLAFNTSKHYVEPSHLHKWDHPFDNVHFVDFDSDIKLWPLLYDLFKGSSYNINRFDKISFHDKLANLLSSKAYDVIQLESLYMAPYVDTIKTCSPAKIVMRSHNIEAQIWETNAKQCQQNWLRKWYYNLSARRLQAYEYKMMPHYDVLLAISSQDKAHYMSYDRLSNVQCVPVGIDSKQYPHSNDINLPPMLGYLGSLDWHPNIEGLKWFFNNVWTVEYAQDKKAFALAGRNPVDKILKFSGQDHIDFHGEVHSAIDFLSQLDIIVVPLFSGSGIRVKILESMAMGKVVISTNKGFEGIDVTHAVNAYVANTKEEFIETIDEVLTHPENISKVGREARNFIQQNFDNQNLASQAINYIQST